jgi:hypothetical protein
MNPATAGLKRWRRVIIRAATSERICELQKVMVYTAVTFEHLCEIPAITYDLRTACYINAGVAAGTTLAFTSVKAKLSVPLASMLAE